MQVTTCSRMNLRTRRLRHIGSPDACFQLSRYSLESKKGMKVHNLDSIEDACEC
jgi:hypothetical protein